MDDRTVRIAAGWIYKKKDGPDWWTPFVLTEANPDTSAPRHSVQDAFRIFDALKEKEFVKEDGEISLPDDKKIPKYVLNWGNLVDFKTFAALSWPDRYLPEWLLKFFLAWKTLLVAAGVLVVTAFFQSFFGKLGEHVFEFIFK
jgi:hypothetical protein